MNKKALGLKTLLVLNFKEFLMGKFIKGKSVFPKTIGEYMYVHKLRKKGPRKSFDLAIYEDNKGNKAIAKMRDARVKGYHYNSLKNEIVIYSILNKTLSRIKKHIKEFRNINIPRLINAVETKDSLIMLTQYVEGAHIDKFDDERKVEIFLKMVDSIELMGKSLTKSEKSFFSKRDTFEYVYLYPLLLIKSIFTYPSLTLQLIKGIPVFLNSLPEFNKRKKLVLTHRDLHFFNILVSEEKLYLIDLQQFVFAKPYQESVTILRYYWKNGRFYSLVLKELFVRNMKDPFFKKYFRGMMINSVTHGLSGAGFSAKVIKEWKDFLSFSLKGDFSLYV